MATFLGDVQYSQNGTGKPTPDQLIGWVAIIVAIIDHIVAIIDHIPFMVG